MLFKTLILPALLACKVLAEPLHITIEVDVNDQSLRSIHAHEEYPYEPLNHALKYQQDLLVNATEAIYELDFSNILGTLKKYQSSVLYQSKHVPDQDLSEGDTAFVEPVFEETTGYMTELYRAIGYRVESLKELDKKGQLYKQLNNDRNSWFLFFNAMRKHLYKCDEDEKKNGCEGQTPFNRLNTEITTFMLNVQNEFRPKNTIVEQIDL